VTDTSDIFVNAYGGHVSLNYVVDRLLDENNQLKNEVRDLNEKIRTFEGRNYAQDGLNSTLSMRTDQLNRDMDTLKSYFSFLFEDEKD